MTASREILAWAQDREATAWHDFDQAKAAYDTDKCEANRAAYEAATWAAQAAVTRLIELISPG